jgi:hypothetical protein
MMTLRDYNAAVEAVKDLPNLKSVVVVGGGSASVRRQDSIFRSIARLELGRPLPGGRAPKWRAAAYLKF